MSEDEEADECTENNVVESYRSNVEVYRSNAEVCRGSVVDASWEKLFC